MISVLLPTTGRPHRAVNCIRQLLATVGDHHRVEVLVEVDRDQETMRRLRPLRLDPRVSVRYSPEYRGCSTAWNAALARSKGEFIVFAADDLVWGDGWLDEALKAMDSLGPKGGLVGFNDGHWNGNDLSTHYMMSRDFIVEVLGGVVAWDWYPHSFNDLEANERAKSAKRFAWAEDSRVYHAHWLFGDRKQDGTDTRKLAEHPSAEAVYEDRRARGFPCDYEPAIAAA